MIDDLGRGKTTRPWQQYQNALHALQSAIKYCLEHEPPSPLPDQSFGHAKHILVGSMSTKAEMGGIVKLLVDKGIFSEAEYESAMTAALEREVEQWTDRAYSYGLDPRVTFG